VVFFFVWVRGGPLVPPPRPAKTGCGERRRGHPGCRQSALNRHNGFDLNHELRFHERLTTNSVLGG
jgi:hypothetical protein